MNNIISNWIITKRTKMKQTDLYYLYEWMYHNKNNNINK